jgi:hypothetical protein
MSPHPAKYQQNSPTHQPFPWLLKVLLSSPSLQRDRLWRLHSEAEECNVSVIHGGREGEGGGGGGG